MPPSGMDDEPNLQPDLTVAEAAELLRMAPQSLQRLAKAGRIGHRRDGRTYKFTPADIEQYRFDNHVAPALNMGRSYRSRSRS